MGLCLLIGSFIFFFILSLVQMSDEEKLGFDKMDATFPCLFFGVLLFYIGIVSILYPLLYDN